MGIKVKRKGFGCIVINTNTHSCAYIKKSTTKKKRKRERARSIGSMTIDIDIIKYFTDSHNIFSCHLKVVQTICVFERLL